MCEKAGSFLAWFFYGRYVEYDKKKDYYNNEADTTQVVLLYEVVTFSCIIFLKGRG